MCHAKAAPVGGGCAVRGRICGQCGGGSGRVCGLPRAGVDRAWGAVFAGPRGGCGHRLASGCRPNGQTSAEFIRAIKEKYPDQLVMADCDNIENALACAGAGADFVGTTMRGYTPETTGINDVDFGFIAQLARECPAKVIAEGHIHTPEQAVQALYAGAFALVVGGAITRPAEITARYTAAINNHK